MLGRRSESICQCCDFRFVSLLFYQQLFFKVLNFLSKPQHLGLRFDCLHGIYMRCVVIVSMCSVCRGVFHSRSRYGKKLRRTQIAVKHGAYGTPESRISAA